MLNFKPGQRVQMKDTCGKIKEGTICEVRSADYVYDENSQTSCTCDWMWQPLEKSWETLEPGDFLLGATGLKIKVLVVLGDVFLTSWADDFSEAGSWYTKEEAKRNGWKIEEEFSDDSPLELTI